MLSEEGEKVTFAKYVMNRHSQLDACFDAVPAPTDCWQHRLYQISLTCMHCCAATHTIG